MWSNSHSLMTLAYVFLISAFMGCTSNPVGESTIGNGKKRISGEVQLDDLGQPARVYVWLEGFNIGTFTDEQGQFSLLLPSGGVQDISGVFRLYFYVANYALSFEEVAVRGGEFIFGEGPLNSQGELRVPKRLEKFLFIRPGAEPSVADASSNPNIQLRVELQVNANVADTATVEIPMTTAGFLGPVFFKNIETDQVFIFESLRVSTKEKVLVGTTPVVRTTTAPFSTLSLPAGTYEIIPFLHIRHEPVPGELLEAIGSNLEELTPNFLRIPAVREGEFLVIN